MKQGAQDRSLVWPVILIGLGLLFLFSNLGWITWNVWEFIFRLWPIWLIAVGLELIIGRRSTAGAVAVLIFTAVLLAGGAWYISSDSPLLGAAVAVEGETIAQPLGGASRAEVRLAPGVGELRLGGGAESQNLIDGTIRKHQREQILTSFAQKDGTALYALRMGNRAIHVPFVGNWRTESLWVLRLNQEVPIDLRVDAGVGEVTLNLDRLNLTALRVDVGVGRATVTLPNRGEYRARIHGGIGELRLRVPQGLGVRLNIDTGLGSTDLPDGYVKQGDVYQSPDYESAQSRVELDLDAGIGSIVVSEVRPE